ncbi:MAG: VanZ family protein [Planctomycetales bacterium]|nr:VanZ family protein [Planctomycetales bacterium]
MRHRALTILFFAYWSFLYIGTHLPEEAVRGPAFQADKLIHVAAYGILAWLAIGFCRIRGPVTSRRVTRWFLILAGFSIFDELTQMAVPGRYADPADFFADLVGISLGMIAGLLVFDRS